MKFVFINLTSVSLNFEQWIPVLSKYVKLASMYWPDFLAEFSVSDVPVDDAVPILIQSDGIHRGGHSIGTPNPKINVVLSSIVECSLLTISHEILETLANPYGYLTALNGQIIRAYEICDPVSATSFELDGYCVSNFVLPSYFDSEGSPPFDYLGKVHRPFDILPGSYAQQFEHGRWITHRM